MRVAVDCDCPTDAPLLRCYGVREGEAPLLIGLPAPEGARLRLTRHLTRETLRAAGYLETPPAQFYLAGTGEHAPAPSTEPAAPVPAPTPAAAPPRPQTGDSILDRLIEQGSVRVQQDGETVILRCGFAPDRPFALAPAFVLCTVENREAVLRWTKKDAAKSAASEEIT